MSKICPQCNTKMEEGILAGAPFWGERKRLFHKKKYKVVTHRCPNCDHIMLYEKDK